MKALKWIGGVLGSLLLLAASAYGYLELTKELDTGPPGGWEAPRTSFGHPSLEGIWTSATITTLERGAIFPAPFNKLNLNRLEAAMIEGRFRGFLNGDLEPTDLDAPPPDPGGDVGGYNTFWLDPGERLMAVGGAIRSSIVVYPRNGRIPYRDRSRALLDDYILGVVGPQPRADGPEQRPLGERCIIGFGSTGGPPMLPVLYNNHYQFVQTPDHVAIVVEMNHDARILRLDSEHLPAHITPWLGDSIASWEGDTLVVETSNFHPGQSYRLAIKHQLYMSPKARVTERFTRVGPTEMLYAFTVEDDEAYTDIWKGEMTLRRTKGPIYEYACHEGNYSLPGILAGARYTERRMLEERNRLDDQTGAES